MLNNVSACLLSLEFWGMLCGILSVLLLARGIFWGFVIGIINAVIYIYVDLSNHIYGQTLVNLYYVIMNILGIWRWTKKNAQNKPKLVYSYSTNMGKFLALSLFISFIIIIYGSYLIFAHYGLSNAKTPFIDSLLTSLIFTAMYLSVHKKIEGWYIWFLVNISAIVLFYYNGLYLTILQYIVYLIISIMGYCNWTQNYKLQHKDSFKLV